jgi:GGDEF domain-containing protein
VSAERTSRAAAAAEQLCATLWEALRDQLQAGSPQQAAMLAERIAEVSRAVSELARIEPDGGTARKAQPAQDSQAGRDASAVGAAQVLSDAPALIVDEESEASSAPIAIRDARHSPDATPWGTVVQRRLDRYLTDRERFAVLLVELLDAERLRLAQPPSDASRQIREVEAAMVAQLRPADALVREADGRYWLIAPDTDAAAARALAGAMAAAARRSASHRAAPLGVAIGIALCPEHGIEAASLFGHAEVDLYAAEAGGSILSDPDGDLAG